MMAATTRQRTCRMCGVTYELASGVKQDHGNLCQPCRAAYKHERYERSKSNKANQARQRREMRTTAAMSPLCISDTCGLCGSPLDEQQRWKFKCGPGHDEVFRLCNSCWSTNCNTCAGYVQCSAPGRLHDPRALPCEWPYMEEAERCNL